MRSKLLFGVHMHQPVDNLGEAVDKAVQDCYAPFFKTLAAYPEFKFALHASGWILEQIRTRYPETFADIKKCNIEFFTGGYYEPVLCSIDKKSQKAQIKKLNAFIFKHFHQTPKGLWLTERVWDSSIIASLTKSKVIYSVVDDYHLYSSGVDAIEGFYTTEDGGDLLDLFPINKELRYKIPFALSEQSLEEIKKYRCAIIFDDLEKFGLWPKTHDWVYGQKWLESFVRGILEDTEIKTLHFHEYHKQHRSKGLVYLQNVSYLEMNEWSLKGKDIGRYEHFKQMMDKESNQFLRGGIWKNFFLKYSESNRLHKRMLEFRSLRSEAFYKAQANDVLWHGAFGGIYLPNLRDNAYAFLITCENECHKKQQKKDVEVCGYEQIKIPTKQMIFRFAQKGGSLIEFDDRQSLFNYQNTLTRREEFYHQDMLTKQNPKPSSDGIKTIHNLEHKIDASVRSRLFFDRYEKLSFLDFISDDFTLEKFIANDFSLVQDFSQKIFQADVRKKEITFHTLGLTKRFFGFENGISFDINLDFEGAFTYILELNLHFAHYEDLTLNGRLVQEKASFTADKFIFRDNFTHRDLTIAFEKPIKLNYFLLQTFSQSEKGVDAIVQGISLGFEVDFKNKTVIKGEIQCQR